MSINEQIDFSTLVWVKKELDETLDRARQALEAYVEDPEDINQLQFCATYLHQVQGTLKMVELYGAAMVAEEMEQVAKKLLEGEVKNPEDAFNVLMRGIVQLPDYLERIQLGHKDIPIVLLPLVNDLRTVRGDQLLSESALFNPDLSLGMPEEAQKSQIKLSRRQLKPIISKIRTAYQQALLQWFKNNDYVPQHSIFTNILNKLQMLIENANFSQLFWVADGAFSALKDNTLKDSVTFRRLAGQLDLLLRKVIQSSDPTAIDSEITGLTKNFLYYVAMAGEGPEKTQKIKDYFNLSQFVPDEQELAHAQGSISGKNRELLETVAGAIRDDVLSVQETLDLYIRNPNASIEELNAIEHSLSAIADTLGILGLGAARETIVEQRDALLKSIESGQRPDDEQLMEMAQKLLLIESTLNDHIQSLGLIAEPPAHAATDIEIPRSEVQAILETLAKESIQNLQHIKSNFVAFIETTWDRNKIRDNPKLLKEIQGALQMLDMQEAATEVGRVAEYTRSLLDDSLTPSAEELDMLADAVASIEYYMEYLGSNSPGKEQILQLARDNLDKLFVRREMAAANAKQEEASAQAGAPLMADQETAAESTVAEVGIEEPSIEDEPEQSFPVGTGDTETGDEDTSTVQETVEPKPSEETVEPGDTPSLIVSFDEDIDPEIKEVFLEELAEELEHMEAIYPQWRANPEENTEKLAEIRRIFHTLKGSGRLVGCEAIGDFGWRVENMCNQVLDGSLEINEGFLAVLDAARKMMPGLLWALQNTQPVPQEYFLLLTSAEQVANGEDKVALLQTTPDTEAETALAPEDDEAEATDSVSDETALADSLDESDPSEEPVSEVDEQATTETLDLGEGLSFNFDAYADEEPETADSADSEELDITFDLEEFTEETREGEKDAEDASGETASLGVDPVFVEILQQEVESHLAEVERFLAATEHADSAEVSDDLIRTIHTLNGAASMANVDAIVSMTSPLEHVLKLKKQAEDSLDAEALNAISEFVALARVIMQDLSQDHAQQATRIGTRFEEMAQGFEGQAVDPASFLDTTGIEMDEQPESAQTTDETFVEQKDESPLELDDAATAEKEESELDFDFDNDHEAADVVEEADESSTANDEACESSGELLTDEEFPALDEALDSLEEELSELDEELSELDGATSEAVKLMADAAHNEDTEALADSDDTEEAEEAEEANATVETAEATETVAEEKTSDEPTETDDDLDLELLEIFAEEMQEILDSCENTMAQLEQEPANAELITALQRELHTLKGGARMAGLNTIGDLSHAMESVFETVAETGGEISSQHYAVLARAFDRLNALLDTDKYGLDEDVSADIKQLTRLLESGGGELRDESRLDAMAHQPEADTPASSRQATATTASSLAGSGQLKVPSALLDNLVNHAGEISIYTSRLEQQTGNTRFNLEELANTVNRLREQLRKLEIETETQIISTYQREAENFDEGFDPLELDRFSTLQQLSRSLSESVSDLTNIQSYLIDITTESENLLKYQSRANTELQEGLMKTRMVAFGSLLPRLRRLIRTTADELHKQARLEVVGAEGEMDKTVLEGIQAPLEHILRNALAHGIEPPEERRALGKDETGAVVLDVQREATEVVITVRDDGRGIDRQKVREIAIEKGIIKPDTTLSDQDIDQLILHSGFSTADAVSKLAGRGVGMDVVHNEVKKLGGMLEIESEPGQGTTFRIRLPYTLALTHAILVEVGETQYALPVSGVEGVVRMSWDEYQRRIENNELDYEYAGEVYRIQDLNHLLDSNAEPIIEDNQVPLVMVRSGNEGIALRVDKVLGSREIVVKTVGTQIASVPGIYGATILGDGTVVLILDAIPLARYWQQRRQLQSLEEQTKETAEESRRVPTIMIVDDSITMRKVGQRVLQRNGFEVITAKDGLDASDQLEEVLPDLMLLDIEMPRMDGYELAGLMQKDSRLSQVPIIMITSRTGEKHRQRAMDLGVKRYLGKPYQEFELIKNIKELLNIEDDES